MIDTKAEEKELKRCLLQKIQLGLRGAIFAHAFENSEIRISCLADEIIYRMHLYLAGTKHETERVEATMQIPISWWEHTKERFVPKYFLKLCPVKYRIVEIKKVKQITNIYPSVKISKIENSCYIEREV